jgi:hypothetical protein
MGERSWVENQKSQSTEGNWEFRSIKGLGQESKNPRKLKGVNNLNKLKGIKNFNRSMCNYKPNY